MGCVFSVVSPGTGDWEGLEGLEGSPCPVLWFVWYHGKAVSFCNLHLDDQHLWSPRNVVWDATVPYVMREMRCLVPGIL